jgi:F-type H+-transporting ATPase subunit b
MPQFDITTYSSQVFWFAICFSLLYFFVSKIILPRISEIIKSRKSVIDKDLSLANKIETEIANLQNEIDALKTHASSSYQGKIEETSKSLAKERENAIENLKNKIEIDIKKSQSDIKEFLATSRQRSSNLISDITEKLKTKILTK